MDRSLSLRVFAAGLLAWALGSAVAGAAPIDPGSPTTNWTAVSYPTLIPDFSDDQQTGIGEADIVGNTSDPAIYTSFDDWGTASRSDGDIGFRVRLGRDKTPSASSTSSPSASTPTSTGIWISSWASTTAARPMRSGSSTPART